jgi:L-iditol 2-dehydrogenase
MKALKYRNIWDIGVIETEDLYPVNADEVIVAVKYCGICGTDVGIVSGDYPAAVKGVTLGHEAAGIIAAIGAEVKNVKVGERVAINPTYYCGECRMCRTGRINHCERKLGTESGVSYDGAFAGRYRTKAGYVYGIPDGVSLQAATLTEPLSCILSGARKLQSVPLNAYAYIFGAGPMGILYAWALSLKGIIPAVIETAPARREFVQDCLPKGVNVYQSLAAARTKQFNDVKAPLDLVVDTTAGLLEELYPQLACGGTYMSIGLKRRSARINTMELADKSLSVCGSIDSVHGAFGEAFHLIVNNMVPAAGIVSHVFPLDQFKLGFATIGCDIDSQALVPVKAKSAKVLLEIEND